MTMDDIIGAMGMENETIEGIIEGAVSKVVIIFCNTFTMCQLYNIS